MTEEELNAWEKKLEEPFTNPTEKWTDHPLVKLQLAATEDFWRNILGDEDYELRKRYLESVLINADEVKQNENCD